VEVALAAADGDLNVAVEILMSQQVLVDFFFFLIICNSTHLLNYLLPCSFLLKMFCLLVYCIYRGET
jgi:hypothetical protein